MLTSVERKCVGLGTKVSNGHPSNGCVCVCECVFFFWGGVPLKGLVSQTKFGQRVVFSGPHYFSFVAFRLDVRTLTFCQLMGFPSEHQKLNFQQGSRKQSSYDTVGFHGSRLLAKPHVSHNQSKEMKGSMGQTPP